MERPSFNPESAEVAVARKLVGICDNVGDLIVSSPLLLSVPRGDRQQAARLIMRQLYDDACDTFGVPLAARHDAFSYPDEHDEGVDA